MTFSAGLGLWRQESAEQLLARVDQALYQPGCRQESRCTMPTDPLAPRLRLAIVLGLLLLVGLTALNLLQAASGLRRTTRAA